MKFTLYGILYQKGNSRMIVRNKRTGKPMVIKSSKALKTTADFLSQMSWVGLDGFKPLKGDVFMKATIYYPNNRHDLDDSLLCDILQKAGVIKNDRQIIHKVLYKYIDPKNPRVEVEISAV